MNDKTHKDVNFIASENDDFFDVEEKIVYGFFSYRIIKSKSGKPFNIINIYGPYHFYYNNDNLELDNIVSVTFVYHKLYHMPFVLTLEKSNKTKNRYRMLGYGDNKWKPIYELKGIPGCVQQKLSLDCLKKVFSDFFKWEIELYESKVKKRSGVLDHRHELISENNYCGSYNKYYLKPIKPISVSKIEINGDKMEIEKSLKFVEHYYFYYQNGYESTPLMMETVDYQIAGSLPYINYFIPESVGNKWVPVECGTDLLEPKCKPDIKRILDGVVEMYRNHPVRIDIMKPKYINTFETIVVLSGIRFSNERENGEYYKSNTFTSKATQTFFIENIMLDNVRQEIDIQSTEFESITVYYKVDQPHMPLLICLKLHNKTNIGVEKFKWFYIPRFDKNVWLKLDFEAHPHNDNKLIEQKIKSIYGSKSVINYIIMPLKWLAFLALIFTILTLLLLRQRRLRLIFMRLYLNIRR